MGASLLRFDDGSMVVMRSQVGSRKRRSVIGGWQLAVDKWFLIDFEFSDAVEPGRGRRQWLGAGRLQVGRKVRIPDENRSVWVSN